jgi:phosphatidylinositol alpha-mannosyltransferase
MRKKTDKLTIGFVLDDSLDKSDGVQQYVLGLGNWFTSKGHEVHYLVGSTKRADLANVHSLSKNVNVRFNGNRMSIPLPSSRTDIFSVLAARPYDVLHVQMPYSPFLAQRIIELSNDTTAVVGTFHILSESRLASVATRLLGFWLAPSLKRFDALLSVSKPAQKFAEKTFKIRSQILPNVLDYDLFHDAKAIKLSKTDVNILFLGRLVPRKGCAMLLGAVERIAQDSDLPSFHVTICGKGPLEHNLRSYVQQHGLQKIVTFTGYVSELAKPSYYSGADISVFPSTGGESFGIVLLEAMASGHSAILAGDNAGYASVMASKPELLFNPKDITGFASLLRKYICDADLRATIKNWGEEYAKEFDINTVGSKLLEIYSQALRKRSKQ